jgi:ubiquitin carboxyl-terminal hydrolase 5/13
MGIPENPAKHALYRTGNSDADAAVTWYFENMADESINQPLRVKKQGAGAANAGGGAGVP